MPVTDPTDPDNVISLVKDSSTRWLDEHLMVGRSPAWLAVSPANVWTTAPTGGHKLSLNTFLILLAAIPNADNTFHVMVNGAAVNFELKSELRDGAAWAVAKTI